MDSFSAFAFGAANRDKPLMVFDWDKAAQIIKERSPGIARAGLSGDWKWTGGKIWAHGQPVPKHKTYTYLASTWAAPELDIDGEITLCWKYKYETPEWDSDTYWPDSALKIVCKGG